MTHALCLSCGDVKFGALVPCFSCSAPSTGDVNLDIAFSDHRIPKDSLEKLGAVVAAIREASDDDKLCFWTFIHYVSIHHTSILGVDLDPDLKSQAEAILSGLKLPEFVIPDESTDATDRVDGPSE